jgi:hypothetical protein
MTQVCGELEAYGFDEIEPGCIPDTVENKRRLRWLGSDWTWVPLLTEEREPTGLIQVFTPSETETRRTDVSILRASILSDPHDIWSDYVHPDSYPLDLDIPLWVLQRLQRWREDGRKGIPEDERRPFPTRCTLVRHDGTRCWNWVGKPHEIDRCKYHINWTSKSSQLMAAYSKNALIDASPYAADTLIKLLDAEGEAVQLKASTEILDRAGVRAGTDLNITGEITHLDPSAALRQKLTTLSARVVESLPSAEPDETVDAEIVSETEEEQLHDA